MRLARKVFGRARVDAAVGQVRATLRSWGYQGVAHPGLSSALCEALLAAGSPRLADLSSGLLEGLRGAPHVGVARRSELHQVHCALAALGIADPPTPVAGAAIALTGVDPAWAGWLRRWLATTTVAPATRKHDFTGLARVGHWLAATHPDIREPDQWTRELCAGYVASLDRSRIGDSTEPPRPRTTTLGLASGGS